MANNPIRLVNENGKIVGRDPDTGEKIPVEFESLSVEGVISDRGRTVDRLQARSKANTIRQAAGIPGGVTVGPRSGTTQGISDSTGLSSRSSDLVINSDSDASSAASTGAGTEQDPYVIKDFDFNGYRFTWDDPDAGYYIRLQNCEIYNHLGWLIRAGSAAQLTVRHCLLYNTADNTTDSIRVVDGTVRAEGCHFAGGTNGIAINSGIDTVEVVDSLVDESIASWGAGVGLINTNNGAESGWTVVARHNDIDESAGIFRHSDNLSGEVEITANDVTTSQTSRAVVQDPYSGVVRYNRFTGVQGIEGRRGNGLVIEHNWFNDAPDGIRLAYFNASGGDHYDLTISQNRFDKSTGSGNGNEAVLARDVTGVEYRENWVTECPEDAYELVKCADATVRDVVADNVPKQIVDVFRGADGTGTDVGAVIDGVYGDGNLGVIITAANDIAIRNVHAKVTHAVRLSGTGSDAPSDITIEGALPLAEVVSGSMIDISGDLGTNVRVQYIDNEAVQRPYTAPRQTELR